MSTWFDRWWDGLSTRAATRAVLAMLALFVVVVVAELTWDLYRLPEAVAVVREASWPEIAAGIGVFALIHFGVDWVFRDGVFASEDPAK